MPSRFLAGYLFALASALSYGIAYVLVRAGVTGRGSPVVGVTISLICGTAILGALESRRLDLRPRSSRRALGLLIFAGSFSALAQLAMYAGLSQAPVAVVVPLLNTTPIFTALASYLFFKNQEAISSRVLLAIVIIVLGATLIGVGAS